MHAPILLDGSISVEKAEHVVINFQREKMSLLETQFNYPKLLRSSMYNKTHYSVGESARMRKKSLKFLQCGKGKLIFITYWFTKYFFLGRTYLLVRKLDGQVVLKL